jgi:hypothetical protein
MKFLCLFMVDEDAVVVKRLFLLQGCSCQQRAVRKKKATPFAQSPLDSHPPSYAASFPMKQLLSLRATHFFTWL